MQPTKILIIEDEPTIANNLVYALETEGYEAFHETTGQDGMETFEREQPDFLVLDVGLPDCTGFDLCRKVRETSQVPILFLTARDSEVDRVLGLEMGGDDYVTKPFSPREISARVRAILRRCEPAGGGEPKESENSKPSGFEHDEVRRVISVQGKKLDLTVHEYKLLLVLMGQPGRVFSRGQLMDAAWEDPGAALERTIDAHIKALRGKLRKIEPGLDGRIETRRGLGYALSEV